jgi:uncharacterized protein
MNSGIVRLFALFTIAALVHTPALSADPACHVGFYRLAGGGGVDISPRDDGKLRWRMPDGTSGELTRGADKLWSSTLGWTGRPDGKTVTFDDCAAGTMSFDGRSGRRAEFVTRDVKFRAGDVELAGRLVMPVGNAKVPIVVLVRGSENLSARRFYADQRLFPSHGVGVFVYDKRGTGDSAGVFTHDYRRLASDAVAALDEARRLAGRRAGRIGLYGTSQGGWVAPLAATQTRVDFVMVGYGLAVSPLDEDTEAVQLDMKRHGFGAAETVKALEVARAAEAIVLSSFRDGFAELRAKRDQYADEPWFKFVRGNVTHLMLGMSEETVRAQGPVLFNGILPRYDPMPALRALNTPQLWVLGEEDTDAPIHETLKRLLALRKSGKPISVVVFPRAEHGMYEFETNEKGERLSTRRPGAHMSLMTDFVTRGDIGAAYEGAHVYRAVRR